ncbi:hypothetical protein H310_00644 [Aphanomyces invadans]|uniref:Calponin-homology (CH) domain-containing protein n=1 Tax=Aphanomyces invadans TaxID=157072 RepID=A0A024UVC3_9STRA|nr:hypothetical protein H310_00644 [Aphanomyces invadans]ETW10304.1 hypothetical protein H310_00644 [Aphanomyces invadans]|eukprot:XP_008861715.1 hypothetical protein H310_00644 [Aphanomyces invadans]
MDALRPFLAPIDADTKMQPPDTLRPCSGKTKLAASLQSKATTMAALCSSDKLISSAVRRGSLDRRHSTASLVHSPGRGGGSRRGSLTVPFTSAAADHDAMTPQDAEPTLHGTKAVLEDAYGRPIAGVKYNKGAMTHMKFRSVDPPAANIHPHDKQIATRMTASHRSGAAAGDVRCGFCHANNMLWHLRCTFCGCCRVSDVPRMHYLVTMILSVDPGISATKLAHQLLQYAKFDGTAVEAEKSFKQATLVRSKAAMVLMTRNADRLRWHIVRMMFMAWKKVRTEAMRSEETMARLIKIKEMQTQGRLKSQVFSNWKNLTMVKWDERYAKLSMASERRIQLSKRYIWSRWMRYILGRLRKKCSYLKQVIMSNQDLVGTTRPADELDPSKQIVHDLKDVLVASIDNSVATQQALTAHLTEALQDIVHIHTMLPSTAGYLVGVSNVLPIVDGFVHGHMDLLESTNTTKKDLGFTQTAVDAMADRIGRFIPWDSLLQWINIQITYIHTRVGRKVFAPIASLQDIATSLATPKLVLHLLWHLQPASIADYDALYADECEKDPLLALSQHSATNRHVQWKLFLKVAQARIFLPDDIASRDDLMAGHFDAYYGILVYMFVMFAGATGGNSLEAMAPGQFSFLQMWPGLKSALQITNAYDQDESLREACRELVRRLRTLQECQVKLLVVHKQLQRVLAMHRQAVLRANLSDFCRRLKGRESMIAVALEKEELVPMVQLDYTRVSRFCSVDDFTAIQLVFLEHVVPVIHIFKASGAASGGKSISEHEFYKLMSQCGLIERKNMTRAYLQLIVQASIKDDVATGAVGTPDVDRFGDVDLTSTEFTEALLRVANHLHEKRPAVPLVDMVKELIEVRLMPVASAIERQGIGSFKRQLRQPDVVSVLRAHDKKLKRLFAFHACEKRGKFMTLAEFEGWLKEQRLIDALFPHTRIKQLFYAVQQDTTDGEVDLELIFAEFVEALAAVAVFRNPNPYVSLSSRLESFLVDNL